MTERDRIIKELTDLQSTFQDYTWAGIIADWVIQDRLRIVGPLVNFKRKCLAYSSSWGNDSGKAIDQTLKLAGFGGEG